MANLIPERALCALLLAPLAGCRGPAAHARDADREVYDIVERRRAELADGRWSFTVEPPSDTLRARLLAQAAPAPERLTLLDCLRIAAETNRAYQDEREALYLAALDLTLERWRFSVQETGTFGAFLQRSFGSDSAGVDSSFGLSKLLGTGLSIVSDIGIDLVRDIGTGDGWDAVTNLSLNITQPLLRGFGRRIVQEPLTQAERDVLYQVRRYESFRRDLALDVANRFFQNLSLYDRLENERANFQRRTTLRERNEAFAEAGQLTDIEVDQARQDELAARDRVVEARRALEAGLDSFKFFLGLPVDVAIELDPESRDAAGEWDALRVELDEETAWRLAADRRLDYATVLDRVDDADRRVAVAADALRAGLEVRLDGSLQSPEGRPLGFRGDDLSGTLELELDLPLDRLPERNAYRAALIDLTAARRTAEEESDRIQNEVRDALRNLEAARESWDIQKRAVELAERRVESSRLSLEAGRAETRDVLESQNALIAAQNEASSALTRFLLAGLQLYRTMELFLVDEDGLHLVPPPQAEDEPEEMP